MAASTVSVLNCFEPKLDMAVKLTLTILVLPMATCHSHSTIDRVSLSP